MSMNKKFPTGEEEKQIIMNAKSHEAGMELLLEIYKPIVISNVLRYSSKYKIPRDDLSQEGSIGLYFAAKRFDYKFNSKFTSWAWLCVDRTIKKFITQERNSLAISFEEYGENFNVVDLNQEQLFSDRVEDLFNGFDFSVALSQRGVEFIERRFGINPLAEDL